MPRSPMATSWYFLPRFRSRFKKADADRFNSRPNFPPEPTSCSSLREHTGESGLRPEYEVPEIEDMDVSVRSLSALYRFRTAMRGIAILALGLLAACAHPAAVVRARNPSVLRFLTGSAADVVTPTRGLWVLQGGGDDVDHNYVRMGEYGGGGDFVVLRASGAAEYNDYIFALCRCDSVETLVFSSREAASDPGVVATILNAEALFIAGGDQSNYVRYWKGTPVEDAIHRVAAKPAPIGGTSAGMAILGEFVYSAMGTESLTSAVAMADPYAADVSLERDFLVLPRLEGVL